MSIRVLIIDDSADIREFLSFILADTGYQVTTASSGEEGLARIRSERPDVIVTDVVMPGMDGLEFLSRLRSDFMPPIPPVIVCSGFEETSAEAIKRGAVAFLDKPIHADTLLSYVTNALGGRRPDAATASEERERANAARKRAQETAARMLAQIDSQRLTSSADLLVQWLGEYFECPSALVALLGRGGLEVVASTDERYPRGACIERSLTNVNEVIETGATLVLADASTHPCFAKYGQLAHGVRFFAGVPLLVDGVAIGTVCIFDRQKRVFEAEETLLLEHLGRFSTRALQRAAAQRPVEPYSMAAIPGAVREETFRLLLGVELRLGQRHADSVEVVLAELAVGVNISHAVDVVRRFVTHSRLAVAALGPSRLAILKRAKDGQDLARQISAAIDALQEDLLAAGCVAVDGTGIAPLGQEVLLLAERGLGRARARDGRVERILVHPEPWPLEAS